MYFDKNQAILETKRILNKKTYSLVRPDFSEYDSIYPFSTENLSYIEKLKVKDKEVLTVCGGFDQCLNLAYKNARKVVNFDVNYLSLAFGMLKYAAIKAFSYNEFFYFFIKNSKLETEGIFCFRYELYLKLRPFLPLEVAEYWDNVYEIFGYDGKRILESRLFHSGANNIEHILFANPYLRTEKNYLKTKENMQHMDVEFEQKNLLEIGYNEEEKYDLMLFSNIEAYLIDENFGCMDENQFIQFIEEQVSQSLNENGVVQLAYQYEYHTPVTLYGNFLQRLCQRNYRVVPKDYMEEKYKKIVFQGLPLNSNYKLLKNRKDCIYLYEKKLEKTR